MNSSSSNSEFGQRLVGKVALVTGGAGAIGIEIARTLIHHGAKVAVADTNTEAGKTLEKEFKEDTFSFTSVDVTDEKEIQDWIRSVEMVWGPIDILVNNAAKFVFGTVTEVTDDDWITALSVNVKGYGLCAKYAAESMIKSGKGGVMVHMASTSSFVAQPKFTPYNTTKGAILQLSKCIAMDYGTSNIRSNCVCPGTILTPATHRHAKSMNMTLEELSKHIIDDHFVKRLGTTKDVANAVLFLVSDESSFITGTHLMVDGGYIAH
jgi:NAD(P)-dependent dehydrogenase (short-subunit alcohol dehydrogenase family)